MVHNLEVLKLIRRRRRAGLVTRLKDVAEELELEELAARGHLVRLSRNGHARPVEKLDPMDRPIPFPELEWKVTAKGIRRLVFFARGKGSGDLFGFLP